MKKRIQKAIKRAALVLLILVLLFGLSSVFLEAGACEAAFSVCWLESSFMDVGGFVYCANGYLFCKKYIE